MFTVKALNRDGSPHVTKFTDNDHHSERSFLSLEDAQEEFEFQTCLFQLQGNEGIELWNGDQLVRRFKRA